MWRTEPTRVENLGDELWVGVKGQSNSVIAGSPRNAFRCSVAWSLVEVGIPIVLKTSNSTTSVNMTASRMHMISAK